MKEEKKTETIIKEDLRTMNEKKIIENLKKNHPDMPKSWYEAISKKIMRG